MCFAERSKERSRVFRSCRKTVLYRQPWNGRYWVIDSLFGGSILRSNASLSHHCIACVSSFLLVIILPPEVRLITDNYSATQGIGKGIFQKCLHIIANIKITCRHFCYYYYKEYLFTSLSAILQMQRA